MSEVVEAVAVVSGLEVAEMVSIDIYNFPGMRIEPKEENSPTTHL